MLPVVALAVACPETFVRGLAKLACNDVLESEPLYGVKLVTCDTLKTMYTVTSLRPH